MSQLRLDILPGRYPGDWRVLLDDHGLPEVASEMMAGMADHLDKCLSAVIALNKLESPDLFDMNRILDRVEEKIASGADIVATLSEDATAEDQRRSLSDVLDLAHWFMLMSLDSVVKGRYRDSMRQFSLSVSFYERYANILELPSLFKDGLRVLGSDELNDIVRQMISEVGRNSVRLRVDQKDKDEFIDWMRDCLTAGSAPRNVVEVRNLGGFCTEWDYKDETLKNWAKEAGCKFIGGRPSKKTHS